MAERGFREKIETGGPKQEQIADWRRRATDLVDPSFKEGIEKIDPMTLANHLDAKYAGGIDRKVILAAGSLEEVQEMAQRAEEAMKIRTEIFDVCNPPRENP